MNVPDGSTAVLVRLTTAQCAACALSWPMCAAVLRGQRATMLNWAAFMFLPGLGLPLHALVGADVNSGVRVDANVAFATASVNLGRGGTDFLELRDLDREQAVSLAAVIAGMAIVGAGRERGPWQAPWTCAALGWLAPGGRMSAARAVHQDALECARMLLSGGLPGQGRGRPGAGAFRRPVATRAASYAGASATETP